VVLEAAESIVEDRQQQRGRRQGYSKAGRSDEAQIFNLCGRRPLTASAGTLAHTRIDTLRKEMRGRATLGPQ
jgi:hypothetical protein